MNRGQSAVRSLVVLGAVALLSLGTPACKRSANSGGPAEPAPAPTPTLGEVVIQDATPDDERPAGVRLDLPAFESRVRKSLIESKLFATTPDAGAPVAARVRIQLSLEEASAEGKAAARAAVRLRIDTRPSEIAAPRWNEDVQAGSETQYELNKKPDRAALFDKLVGRTLDDLLSAYTARQKLWSGEGAAIHTALGSDAGELRMEAIRVAGERKLRSEASTLLALLEDPDEATRDAALGALVTMREQRAVTVLANQRSMRDRREMHKILDAIALLGGPEANEYLSFVADGHDDPEIRALAAEAKKKMLRREDGGGR